MGLVAMDNGESPGHQDASANTCSRSTVLGRAGMETNGARSTVGLRTMKPENNLMVFERGSLASTNTGAPKLHTYLSTQSGVRKVSFVILYYLQLNPKTTTIKPM